MIDPTSQTGRVLILLADGTPRTSREISDTLGLQIARVTTIAHRLRGAVLLKAHGYRKHGGRGPSRRVWTITSEGRERLAAALAAKEGQ